MRRARVLVVDNDTWTQRMVSAVLAHAGHAVDVSSDGWEALLRAGSARPELVITDIVLPTTDGWSFAETLRSRPETSDVPVIFLASFNTDQTAGPGFRPDKDAVLAKPFRLEQLEALVAHALGTPEPLPAPAPVEPLPRLGGESGPRRAGLQGSLDQFGISSVLILMELERKSGMLVLRGEESTGRIHLREGRVVRATIEKIAPTTTDSRSGALAVYELLTWTGGRFDFNAGAVDGEDEIGSSTSFLLMEGARLQDERKQDEAGN